MSMTIDVDGHACRVIGAHLKVRPEYGVLVHNDNPVSDKKEYGAAIYDAESGDARDWTFHDSAAVASIVAHSKVIEELTGAPPTALEQKGIHVRDGEVQTDAA